MFNNLTLCIGAASGVEFEGRMDQSGAAEVIRTTPFTFRGPPSTGFTMAQVFDQKQEGLLFCTFFHYL
jgi:hypothetical protein